MLAFDRQRLLVGGLCLAALCGIYSFLSPASSQAIATSTTGCRPTTEDSDASTLQERSSPLDQKDSNNPRQSSIASEKTAVFDFAIVGFPKCATTFLETYFRTYVDSIYMPRRELCAFYNNTHAHEILSRFYEPYELCEKDPSCGTSGGSTVMDRWTQLHQAQVKRVNNAEMIGFKCPRVLDVYETYPSALEFFKSHNPKFIVQIRHPVLWFESYYNYKSKERYPEALLDPNELVGHCDERNRPYVVRAGLEHRRNVCTDRSKFQIPLARLGLTPLQSERELELLEGAPMAVHRPGDVQVFLLEVGQLDTSNATRAVAFQRDLQRFLGLKKRLPPFPAHHKSSKSETPVYRTINICDSQHSQAHAALMENARTSAKWIREYFIPSRNVKVTSPEFLNQLLEQWNQDPCLSRSL